MEVTTVLGSPRKEGNTAKVLDLFEKLKEFASEIIGKVNGYQESTERGLIIRTQFFTHKK
jgi:multimeric flavodoxin WrbA